MKIHYAPGDQFIITRSPYERYGRSPSEIPQLSGCAKRSSAAVVESVELGIQYATKLESTCYDLSQYSGNLCLPDITPLSLGM